MHFMTSPQLWRSASFKAAVQYTVVAKMQHINGLVENIAKADAVTPSMAPQTSAKFCTLYGKVAVRVVPWHDIPAGVYE